VSQQVMGQQDGLGVLEVGATGHRDVDVLVRLGDQGVHDLEHQRAHGSGVVAQVHTEQGGHLVVARATGAEPTADVGAGALDQAAFERRVDVFVVLVRAERPRLHVDQEPPESVKHGAQARVVEQTGAVQHPGMRARPRDVVGREPPVEVR